MPSLAPPVAAEDDVVDVADVGIGRTPSIVAPRLVAVPVGSRDTTAAVLPPGSTVVLETDVGDVADLGTGRCPSVVAPRPTPASVTMGSAVIGPAVPAVELDLGRHPSIDAPPPPPPVSVSAPDAGIDLAVNKSSGVADDGEAPSLDLQTESLI